MAGRLKICVLIATCSLTSQTLLAQGPAYSGSPGAVRFSTYEEALGGSGAPVSGGSPYGMGQFAPVNAPSGTGYFDYDGTVVTRSEHEEIDDDGELGVTPLEKAIHRAIESSWVRFSYLNWTIDERGGQTPDFDLESIGLHNVNGAEVTLGLPTNFGSFEVSGFLLEQASVDLVAILSTPSFARFTSNVWGADINFIMDPTVPGEGFKLRPMGGLRYFAIQEALAIPGEYTSADPSGKIDVFNNIIAPQFGLRAELVHRWFTIGVEPKAGLGVNTFLAEFKTRNNFENTPDGHPRQYDTTFAPFGDLDVYSRVPCGEHFAIYAAYNLIFMAGVSRPHDNIGQDSTGAYVLDPDSRGFRLEGFTLGAELIF